MLLSDLLKANFKIIEQNGSEYILEKNIPYQGIRRFTYHLGTLFTEVFLQDNTTGEGRFEMQDVFCEYFGDKEIRKYIYSM